MNYINYKIMVTNFPYLGEKDQCVSQKLSKSLMNILVGANTLIKILANRVQQHTKRIMHHDHVEIIPGMIRVIQLFKYQLINVIQHINGKKTEILYDWIK